MGRRDLGAMSRSIDGGGSRSAVDGAVRCRVPSSTVGILLAQAHATRTSASKLPNRACRRRCVALPPAEPLNRLRTVRYLATGIYLR